MIYPCNKLNIYLMTSCLWQGLTRRTLLDTLCYQAPAGCAWQLLPHDLSPQRTVYQQYDTWRENRPRARA